MGREHPTSRPRAALQMAHAQQLAPAGDIVWEQEMIMRQAAAELKGNQNTLTMMQQDAAKLTRDQNIVIMMQQAVGGQLHQNMMGLDATLVHGLHGHPDLHQQTVQQGLMMMQEQQYAHAMPGATNMAFCPGGSADAEALPVKQKPQPPLQTVNALGFQTDLLSLPPSLANLPRQQEKRWWRRWAALFDLTAYFGIPGLKLSSDHPS
ncbi:hypothetical protein EJB05_14986, partial [Eragrostis curvula]